jgi:hypothetical protein
VSPKSFPSNLERCAESTVESSRACLRGSEPSFQLGADAPYQRTVGVNSEDHLTHRYWQRVPTAAAAYKQCEYEQQRTHALLQRPEFG